jgi:anion-transporting  ArsA/GET3 family ATPase
VSPLDRKVLIVIGKGGVGRTTVACTLALAAGQQGKRAAVIELYGNDQIAHRFALGKRSYTPRRIGPNVDTFSLTAYECLDDFGRRKLKVNALVRVLFHNRVFRAFVDAVPGLHDLFQLGKIHHLATEPSRDEPKYDLVVIDAPATGHGLTLLSAAQSMREMVGGGLVSDESGNIAELLRDERQTGLVVVSLPDTLPVNESLELIDALADRSKLLCGVVINQVRDVELPASMQWTEVEHRLHGAGRAGLIELGRDRVHTFERQRAATDRMRVEAQARTGRAVPIWSLGRIEPRELHRDDLPGLATSLLHQVVGSGQADAKVAE